MTARLPVLLALVSLAACRRPRLAEPWETALRLGSLHLETLRNQDSPFDSRPVAGRARIQVFNDHPSLAFSGIVVEQTFREPDGSLSRETRRPFPTGDLAQRTAWVLPGGTRYAWHDLSRLDHETAYVGQRIVAVQQVRDLTTDPFPPSRVTVKSEEPVSSVAEYGGTAHLSSTIFYPRPEGRILGVELALHVRLPASVTATTISVISANEAEGRVELYAAMPGLTLQGAEIGTGCEPGQMAVFRTAASGSIVEGEPPYLGPYRLPLDPAFVDGSTWDLRLDLAGDVPGASLDCWTVTIEYE